MLLNKKTIQQEKRLLKQTAKKIKHKSNWYNIVADPTRLKIIFLLKTHQELCVTDLADILDMTVSAVSHQLRLLENCRLVKSARMGKIICYSLIDKKLKIDL